MSQFKDKIRAAGGRVEFLYDPASGGLASQISGFGLRAVYQIAVSLDGRNLLCEVPVTGIGHQVVYPRPSVLTFIQSDEQGLWGRNCPVCKKYFRTNHVMGIACCPYCTVEAPSLEFISSEQRTYITAYYDAFMRTYIGKKSTVLALADITDADGTWHYSEEKQQVHFLCDAAGCRAETDILGVYGYCPRCGRTSARKLFADRLDKLMSEWDTTDKTVNDRNLRQRSWEEMTVTSLSNFEALAKHLRIRLLLMPMTPKRKKSLEGLNFQKPFEAEQALTQWFDIGLMEWPGDGKTPKRIIPQSEHAFIKKMIQKRHILMHNDGLVDDEYLKFSGDTGVRLNERVSVGSKEVKRFVGHIRNMAENLMDNIEYGLMEA